MNNELYHHGILGMKWGVRRYQNKDGSLTPAGKKRYATDSMTNEELRSAVKRKQLENRYVELKSNTGKYKNAKENIELASTALNTASNVGGAMSKAYELSGNKKGQAISKMAKDTSAQQSKDLRAIKKEIKADFDLENMSDEELKSVVDRMNLEQQYNQYYNSNTEHKGREAAREALEVSGAVAGIAATALGIALAIKELRGD